MDIDKFLIEERSIGYLSATHDNLRAPPHPSRGAALVMGSPAFGTKVKSPSLFSLPPESRQENLPGPSSLAPLSILYSVPFCTRVFATKSTKAKK